MLFSPDLPLFPLLATFPHSRLDPLFLLQDFLFGRHTTSLAHLADLDSVGPADPTSVLAFIALPAAAFFLALSLPDCE